MKLRANKRTILDPVRPSAAAEAWYAGKLEKLIKAMDASLFYWIKAMYRAHPHTTEDAASAPTRAMAKKLDRLAKEWQTMFDHMSKELATKFVDKAVAHTDLAMRASLKKAGFSINFQMTQPMRNAFDAKVMDNVSLIKSISSDHLHEVKMLVSESVQKGRSMKELTEGLHDILTIDHTEWDDSKTLRRARLIARTENNKATSLFVRTRQKGFGITKAIWSHTSASIHPREEHEEWNGEEYDVEEGMDSVDDGPNIFPGELPNCGCSCRSVVPGFDEEETE